MKRLLFYVILITLIPLFVVAQNQKVVISGKIEGFSGKNIRLSCYSDYLSQKEFTLDKKIIDANGNFKFNAEIDQTTLAFVRIMNIKATLYLEPGQNYEIILPSKDSLTKGNEARLYSYIPIEILPQIQNKDSNDLNFLIQRFNFFYNSFLLLNYKILTRSRNRKLLDSLYNEYQHQFGYVKNEFFQNYTFYRFASLEMLQRTMNNKALAKKYITEKPIQYNNIEYMLFFNEFFNRYFSTSHLLNKEEEIIKEINQNASYTGLIKILRSDSSIVTNAALRELVLIKGLMEIYGLAQFSKENIIKILDYIAKNSFIKPHRLIAENVIRKLQYNLNFSEIENTEILFLSGQKKLLSQLKGRYIYLCFFTSWNTNALEEIAIMDQWNKRYNEQLHLVAICVDKNLDEAKTFFKGYPGESIICTAANIDELIEHTQLDVFPRFFFINPEGKFISTDALAPSKNFEKKLKELFAPPNKKDDKRKKRY